MRPNHPGRVGDPGVWANLERVMGNPAGVRRKKAEKRRAKFEARLGPAAYLPADVRAAVNAELAKAAAEPKAKKPAAKK